VNKPLTDNEIQAIRNLYDQTVKGRVWKQGACLVWAGLTTAFLRQRGERALIIAGSATFRGADPDKVPPPLPTHGSFHWKSDDPLWVVQHELCERMPEFHAWCGVIRGREEQWIVDLSAGYMPEYFKPVFDHAGVVWTVDTPEVIQIRTTELAETDLFGYMPYRDACMYTLMKYREAARELGLPQV